MAAEDRRLSDALREAAKRRERKGIPLDGLAESVAACLEFKPIADAAGVDDIAFALEMLQRRLEAEAGEEFARTGSAEGHLLDLAAVGVARELWRKHQRQVAKFIEQMRQESLRTIAYLIEESHPGNSIAAALRQGTAQAIVEV